MAIQKFTIPAAGGRKSFTLYGEAANINFFLKTPITGDAAVGASNKSVDVKAHQRRQYPGDTALSNVPPTAREIVIDPTRRSGNGLPGRSVVLVGDPGLPGEERRTFTLKGNWIDFHSWLTGKAKMQIHAYNNTGARYTIDSTT